VVLRQISWMRNDLRLKGILFRFSMVCLFQGDFESTGPLRLCHSKSMGLSVPRNAMVKIRGMRRVNQQVDVAVLQAFLPTPSPETTASAKAMSTNMIFACATRLD
jgi:hypothetical protein